MTVTMQQVLAELDRDEPDYPHAAELGTEALPHLRQIIEANDPLRAAKAAYLASLIPNNGSTDLLRQAADRREPEVRVAVAHALRNTAQVPTDVLGGLLDDPDPGVRKVALSTVRAVGVPELRDKVEHIAEHDSEAFVREVAAEAVRAQQG